VSAETIIVVAWALILFTIFISAQCQEEINNIRSRLENLERRRGMNKITQDNEPPEEIKNRRFIIKNVTGPRKDRLINANRALGVPVIGDPHPVATDPQMFCALKSTSPIRASSRQFEVMCIYRTLVEESQT